MPVVDRSCERRFRVGDPVVYVITKFGVNPGRRAEGVHPLSGGDLCSYTVEKYWRVTGETPQGELIVMTRSGKKHTLKQDDPKLRRPSWLTYLVHSSRFPPTPAPDG